MTSIFGLTNWTFSQKGKVGLSKHVKFSSLKSNFLALFQQQKSFALEIICGRNAGRRPKIWRKITSGTFKQVKLTSLKLNFLQVNLYTLTFSKFNLTFDF